MSNTFAEGTAFPECRQGHDIVQSLNPGLGRDERKKAARSWRASSGVAGQCRDAFSHSTEDNVNKQVKRGPNDYNGECRDGTHAWATLLMLAFVTAALGMCVVECVK